MKIRIEEIKLQNGKQEGSTNRTIVSETGLSADTIREGHFKHTQSYGKEVGKLSKRYGIPFEVGLALGTDEENYKKFVSELNALKGFSAETFYDLYAGITRRKKGLSEVLSPELYKSLKIDEMGQKNSQRVAMYILEKFRIA